MADSAWATAEPQLALTDLTPAANGATTTGPPKNEDALKVAREAGWVPPTAHNYISKAPAADLNKDGGEAQPDLAPASEGQGTEDVLISRSGASTWAHDSAKYEWKEEFGDVGPRDELLERELFEGEFIQRAGAKLEK
jgi:ATP-dependent RNA helicase DDX3X